MLRRGGLRTQVLWVVAAMFCVSLFLLWRDGNKVSEHHHARLATVEESLTKLGAKLRQRETELHALNAAAAADQPSHKPPSVAAAPEESKAELADEEALAAPEAELAAAPEESKAELADEEALAAAEAELAAAPEESEAELADDEERTRLAVVRWKKEHGAPGSGRLLNPRASEPIRALQAASKKLLLARYGSWAWTGGQPGKTQGTVFRIQLHVVFPPSMPDSAKHDANGIIVLETAPIELMPHAVKVFMDIATKWQGAQCKGGASGLTFQEYSEQYPHADGTMGYAGRPGGPEFYISTMDNTHNHGPGSQGSKTEADSCFGRIIEGQEVVERMLKVWGHTKDGDFAEFLENQSDHVKITRVKVLEPKPDWMVRRA